MPILQSYSPNYFSVEDILATQERVPCKVLVSVRKLGKLNPASEDNDLAAGTAIELPFWLVGELVADKQPMVSADLPKIFTEPFREILKADPCAVNLYKWNLHFYELGFYVKHLDLRKDVANILIYSFITRFRQLMDLSDNAGTDPTVGHNLDFLEKRLFQNGLEARNKLNVWLGKSAAKIEASTMVTNHKKRKRADLTHLLQ